MSGSGNAGGTARACGESHEGGGSWNTPPPDIDKILVLRLRSNASFRTRVPSKLKLVSLGPGTLDLILDPLPRRNKILSEKPVYSEAAFGTKQSKRRLRQTCPARHNTSVHVVFGDLHLVPERVPGAKHIRHRRQDPVDSTFSMKMGLNFIHIWSKGFCSNH